MQVEQGALEVLKEGKSESDLECHEDLTYQFSAGVGEAEELSSMKGRALTSAWQYTVRQYIGKETKLAHGLRHQL